MTHDGPTTNDLRFEEAKRERNWNPADRYRVLLETVAWVDAQQPIPRNSREGCLREQTKLLQSFDEWQRRQLRT